MLPGLPDIPVFVALLIVLVIMAVFGAINGCVIAFLKVPPFIATLGMQTIVYGLCSVITDNQPMGGYKPSYSKVALGSLGPIPYLALFAILVGLTWKRCTRQGAFWAMASGMVVGVAWMLLGLTDTLEAVYPTVLVSYTVGVVVSLATSKKMHGLAKE